LLGHSGSQAPQFMHSSVIFIAIYYNFRFSLQSNKYYMKLQQRIELLVELGKYLRESGPAWQAAKENAFVQNGWFTPTFIDLATANIEKAFLQPEPLQQWAQHYRLDDNIGGKNVGIVMAGNIPLVGFHDFLCVFLSGHSQTIKASGKDNVLLKHLVQVLYGWEVTVQNHVSFAEMLKGCDAYIATGSNNTARYFDYYFGRYPSIIRRNRTSVAIVTGEETADDLDQLADDICQYFGLGCRNVTHLMVPVGYNFEALLAALNKYKYFADHHKYKNNFDYHLTIQIMNNRYYMTNDSVVLVEDEALFSPIGQLNYRFYTNRDEAVATLQQREDVQCIVGQGFMPFGSTQNPSLIDYADGLDTMQFLLTL
jgi:Acyl-CoA reductase (LuxC)